MPKLATPPRRPRDTEPAPRFVEHKSFHDTDAPARYDPTDAAPWAPVPGQEHMPDDITREHARRMHYAAWRIGRARTSARRDYWKTRYFHWRDAIVMGNRKLVYRAVQQRQKEARHAEDLIGESFLVLIQAVGYYNPWLGIRFSTYAYTCLMRALARQGQKLSADRLARAVSLEGVSGPGIEPAGHEEDDAPLASAVGEYLQEDHPLLTPREKDVLRRRLPLAGQTAKATLEGIGHELGLSKERVRQVQASALDKLRAALEQNLLA